MRLTLFYAARFYRDDNQVYVQPAYGTYVEALAAHAAELVLCGPVSDEPVAGSGFPLKATNIRVVGLPYFERDVEGVRVLKASLRGIGEALTGADLASIMLPLGLLGPTVYALARRRRVPVWLHVVGDLTEQWSPSDYSRAARWAAQGVIALLERAQQWMIGRCPTFVQGSGLMAKHQRPGVRLVQAMETTIYDRHVLPQGRRWPEPEHISLLYAGNLIRPKGVHVLLDALKTIRESAGGYRLTVAGSGPELGPLRQQAAELGLADHVEFAGFQSLEGVMSLMDRAHLFVFPSFGEGMPRVLLEAMARGLPIVSTDVGGISGLIRSGVNGWLVPSRDADALARAIRGASTDPVAWEAVSAAGISTARAHTMDHYARLIVAELGERGLWT